MFNAKKVVVESFEYCFSFDGIDGRVVGLASHCFGRLAIAADVLMPDDVAGPSLNELNIDGLLALVRVELLVSDCEFGRRRRALFVRITLLAFGFIATNKTREPWRYFLVNFMAAAKLLRAVETCTAF